MKVFNTLSGKKENFTPVKKGKVGMYLCGPTVYDNGHIGHARSAIAFDIVRKYLRYKGFDVKFVSNYTDIDDKMIQRATELGISVKELADKIIPLYARDYAALGIEKPDASPKATEFIPQIVKIVEELIKKGFAYSTKDGIYFSVKSFHGYGKLSHQKLDELVAGARVDVNEQKQSPEDFAVWKKEKSGEPAWDGPAGMRGRPGWHIECSAMTMTLLGETFDIHAGGQDLIFPHHEDEIAQSEAATGKQFVKYWLHNGFIRVNSEKMSKSLGNFFTIEDVLKKYNPAVVRYFLLSTHYRMPIDFSSDLLDQAKESLKRLRDCARAVKILIDKETEVKDGADIKKSIKAAKGGFEKAMDDDFEISRALACIFELVNQINGLIAKNALNSKSAQAVADFFAEMDKILGVMEEQKAGVDSAEIEQFIKERNQARAAKNWALADEIRVKLLSRGIELEDTKGGTIWKLKL